MKTVIALMIVLSAQYSFAETKSLSENSGSVVTIREVK